MPAAFPCVEAFGIFIHESVQFIQVDVCKDWTDNGTLWSAGIGVVVNPVLHISGFQEFPNQADEVLVFDSSAENINKNVVVNIVKTAFDVTLNKPFHPRKSLFDLQKCCVAASVRSESV